jgi:2-polyprenyl-6-methoxyphenol hydroxylase-like FAD-dependent oxidoreductase
MSCDDLSKNWDVVVVGGGPAGVPAAIQAARAGARTLLVEKSSRLGGTLVNGGVTRPGLFHAWGRQVIAGIGWDLVREAVALEGGALPDFAGTGPHWSRQVTVNPAVFTSVCDEHVLSSGAGLLFHAMVAAAAPDATGGWTLSLCTKDGLLPVTARVLVDATGDADAVRLAGFPLRVPEASQPATLCFRMSGYDVRTLDLPALNAAFAQAVKDGEVRPEDGCWHIDKPAVAQMLRNHGDNANHVRATPEARGALGRSALEVEGRRAVARLLRWMRRQPGLEGVRLDSVFPETGIRETATIQGRETVTLADVQSGRVWPDAVCNAFYPIDLHGMTAAEWQAWPLAEGTVATIPRGALIPLGSRNLLAAGRCFSSDRLANSALRVMGSCMAMGQAAGALAALAVAESQDVADVPADRVHALLDRHGAIRPGESCALDGAH